VESDTRQVGVAVFLLVASPGFCWSPFPGLSGRNSRSLRGSKSALCAIFMEAEKLEGA
jgi:hypothetical protein